MLNRPKKESDGSVRVQYPYPGQRFVDANELLSTPKAREQIERMANLARNSALNNNKDDSDA